MSNPGKRKSYLLGTQCSLLNDNSCVAKMTCGSVSVDTLNMAKYPVWWSTMSLELRSVTSSSHILDASMSAELGQCPNRVDGNVTWPVGQTSLQMRNSRRILTVLNKLIFPRKEASEKTRRRRMRHPWGVGSSRQRWKGKWAPGVIYPQLVFSVLTSFFAS